MAKKKTQNPSREEETVTRKKRMITVNNKDNLQGKTEAENCCPWILLPLDIEVDILLRLPAKSIAKCRCVCKQWLSLTSDLRFLKLHHEKSASYKIIDKFASDGEINMADFSIGGGKKSNDSSYRRNLGRKRYELSNFVDGLTCAYANTAKSDMYLLNPTTKEFQKLPKKNSNSHRAGFILESVGLGTDMTMEQYKVVRLIFRSESNRVDCEIYNVGTAQWRCLGEAPFRMWDCKNPVFLHGALYWVGYVAKGNNEGEEETGLFRFDIKYEKFGSAISIPCPSSFRKYACRFNESGGELWVTFAHPIGYYEIWTMKELNNTWVRKYKFNSSLFSSFLRECYIIGIVDGNLILRTSGLRKRFLIHYNPRSGALQKLLDEQGSHRDFSIFRESLISPKKLMNPPQPRRQPKKGGGSEKCILCI